MVAVCRYGSDDDVMYSTILTTRAMHATVEIGVHENVFKNCKQKR